MTSTAHSPQPRAVPCIHWSADGRHAAKCALGIVKNPASGGFCMGLCMKFDIGDGLGVASRTPELVSLTLNGRLPKAGAKDEKKCLGCFLKRAAKGGFSLLKSELGVDAAADAVEATRKAACLTCEHQDLGVCTRCGCFCAAKITINGEKCPDDPPRW